MITLLFIKKVIIFAKYLDFTNMFLKESVAQIPKYLNINNQIFNLKEENHFIC